MGQNKEQLNKLLDFIAELAKDEDNAWFIKELGNRYGKEALPQIVRIEKYLALDFVTDTANSTIDYSFINDIVIRNQLVSDNREMMRYRYGVRSHKIDFDEFCRFAHLQAEMLVNYYYKITCVDFAAAKGRVIQYNPQAKINDNYPEIESIPYGYKIKAIVAELYPKKNGSSWFSSDGQRIYTSLSNVKDVRNMQSHRGHKEDCETFVTKYENDARTSGLPWDESKKEFKWSLIKVTPRYKMIYDSCFKEEATKYNYCKWYIQKPFDDIIIALKTLSVKTKDVLFSIPNC